jgi:diguanylate cyclase
MTLNRHATGLEFVLRIISGKRKCPKSTAFHWFGVLIAGVYMPAKETSPMNTSLNSPPPPEDPLPSSKSGWVNAVPFRFRSDRVAGRLHRLSGDLQLGLITLFGLLGVVAIAPFAFYRFLIGDIFIGIVDSLIVVLLAGSAWYAWRTNKLELVGNFLAAVTGVACIVVVYLFELSYLWAFCTYLATFIVGGRHIAFLICLCTLTALAFHEPSFERLDHRITFVAVSGIVVLFAMIFATRSAQHSTMLRDMALIDPLTEAANRRALRTDLLAAVAGSHKNNEPYGLAVIDLDHFEKVNDLYGHDAGDQVLIDLVEIIKGVIRRGDRLYRYGGEEFVLLFAGVEGEGLKFVTGKIQQAVRKQLRGPGGPVTISIGATELSDSEHWQDWLARADRALYQAKNLGRDRTVIDPR